MKTAEGPGTIWDLQYDWRIVPTNGIVGINGLVMGKGLALQARNRYPALPSILGRLVTLNGNVPHIINDYRIISLPTKNHWRDKSTLELIERSVRLMIELLGKEENKKIDNIAIPRVGCGLGGLKWELVRMILESLLDDRFILVEQS